MKKILTINENLSSLTADQFKKWFDKRFKGENWEDYYKKIGGKIQEKKISKDK